MPRSYLVPAPRAARAFYSSDADLRTTNRFGVAVVDSFVTAVSVAGQITAKSRVGAAPSVTVRGAVNGAITAQSRMKGSVTISVALHGRIEAKSRASTFIPLRVNVAGRMFSKSNMRIVPPGIKTLAGQCKATSALKSIGFTSAPAARTKDYGVTIING